MTDIDRTYTQQQADSYDQIRFESNGGRWTHENELGIIKQPMNDLPPQANVLEVGCGTGRLLIELARDGHIVHGIDPSKWMLDVLRDKFNASSIDVECHEARAETIPYPDGKFDYVFAIRVISLAMTEENLDRWMGEMFRVLKPGGKCLVGMLAYYRLRYRPTPRTVMNIRPHALHEIARHHGGDLNWFRGGFFFGLPLYLKLPPVAVRMLGPVDGVLSRLLPFLANQNYALYGSREAGSQDESKSSP